MHFRAPTVQLPDEPVVEPLEDPVEETQSTRVAVVC